MLNVTNSPGLDLTEVNEDLYAVKMGNGDSSLICTYGKIKVWFGRKASKGLVKDILFGISKVDSCIEFEFETICGFDTIQHYENVGFTLVSYAKYAPSGSYPPHWPRPLTCIKPYLTYLFQGKKPCITWWIFSWRGSTVEILIAACIGVATILR